MLAALLSLVHAVAGCGDDDADADAVQYPETLVIPFTDPGGGTGGEGTGGPGETGPGGTDQPTGETGETGNTDGPEDPPDGDEGDGCLPLCDDRECGPDGCDGDCGKCGDGFQCSSASGACLPFGDSCDEAILMPNKAQWAYSGSTAKSADTAACGEQGVDSGDTVFRLDHAGLWRVTLEAEHDARLYALDDCAAEVTCQAAEGDELVIQIEGAPRYIVVDGADAESVGTFSLGLSKCANPCPVDFCGIGLCGVQCECSAGKVCGDAAVCLEAATGNVCSDPLWKSPPLSDAKTTTGYSDTLACPDGSGVGADVVYGIQIAGTTSVVIGLEGAAGAFAYLQKNLCQADCADELRLEAGETLGTVLAGIDSWFLIVETADEPYTLTVDTCPADSCAGDCQCALGATCEGETCVVAAGGNDCGDAIEVGLGSTDNNTTGKTDTQACSGFLGQQESVLSFTAQTAGPYSFEVVADHLVTLYALETCGDPETCVGPVVGADPLSLELEAQQTVWLAVEENGFGAPGGFEVTITDCEAECMSSPCDAVVCGKPCGCADGLACKNGACQGPKPGDACALPIALTKVPAQASGNLAENTNGFWCEGGAGLQTADAIHWFVAPTTGVFLASVIGPSGVTLLRGEACKGGTACTAASTSHKFVLHKGESVFLSVEGNIDSPYQLSVVRLFGAAGSLGAACSSDADCTLADHCLAGVCTLRCTPSGSDGACVGAANGPRGKEFGCAADACLDFNGACKNVCLPGVKTGEDALCKHDGACTAPAICVGWLSGPPVTGACMTGGSLAAAGADCNADAACQSNACQEGACRSLCDATPQCPNGSKCAIAATPLGPGGTCFPFPGAGDAPCSSDAQCSNGLCEGHITPAGQLETWCKVTQAGLKSVGDPCDADAQCESASCFFEGVLGLQPSYCTAVCPSASDCAEPLKCVSMPVTANAALPICAHTTSGFTCPLGAEAFCDEGLECKNLLSSAEAGVCY